MQLNNIIKKIENQYSEIKEKDEIIADQLSPPIKAIRSGYHENAVFLCGNILHSILREILQREVGQKEIHDKSIKELYEAIKDKIEDQLIIKYFGELMEGSKRADSGKHLRMEEAHEMLRKQLSVVMWYLEKYPPSLQKRSIIRKKSVRFGFLLFFVFLIATNVGIHFFLNNTEPLKPLNSTKVLEDGFPRPAAILPSNISQKPETSIDWMELGAYQYQTANLNGAINSYTHALKLMQDYGLYALRAKVYQKKGLHEKALYDCNKSIELKPKNEYAYALKGEIFEEEGKLEEAENCFLKGCLFGNSASCKRYERLTGKKVSKILGNVQKCVPGDNLAESISMLK